MSDPDDDIRSTATNTFASLVKMVPLEVGISFDFHGMLLTYFRRAYRTLPVSRKNFYEGETTNVSSWHSFWTGAKSKSTYFR